MATLEKVLVHARTLLNDDDAIKWPDFRIVPKVQLAFDQCVTNFVLNGIPVTTEVSAEFTVPANANVTNLNTDIAGFPTDIIEPVRMQEKLVGQTDDYFITMTNRDFLPTLLPTTRLIYWRWADQVITVPGVQNPVVVQLYYRKDLTAPVYNTDVIEIDQIDDYLGYKTAELCLNSIGDSRYSKQADDCLDNTIRMNVKQQSNLPAKRRPYHRRNYNRATIGVYD